MMTVESGPHIIGRQPEDNAILWRYMDFHQLYDLLTQKQLTFVSPDFFEDKLEGHYSQKTFEKYTKSIEQNDIEHLEINFHNIQFVRESSGIDRFASVFVSCWHQAQRENMFMWKCYGGKDKGVAVRVEYKKFKELFPYDYHIGLVDYNENQSSLNLYDKYFYKRSVYEDERELRVVYLESRLKPDGTIDDDNREGIYKFPVNPQEFIKDILISPFSTSSFYDSVKTLADQHNIDVCKSSLSSESTQKFDNLHRIIEEALREVSKSCARCHGMGYRKISENAPLTFCICVKVKESDFFNSLLSKI